MWTEQVLKKHNLVEIKNDEYFIVDLIYAKKQNIMNEAVYDNVGQPHQCVVHNDVLENLNKIKPILKNKNLKLKICDAYRHPKAHLRCLEIIPKEGFFAKNPASSQHCRACAIDVILVDAKSNNELEFPCAVDAYDKKYVKEVLQGDFENFFKHLKKADYSYNIGDTTSRDFLRKLMESAGFFALQNEWWHFNMEPKDATEKKYKMIELPLI